MSRSIRQRIVVVIASLALLVSAAFVSANIADAVSVSQSCEQVSAVDCDGESEIARGRRGRNQRPPLYVHSAPSTSIPGLTLTYISPLAKTCHRNGTINSFNC